MNHNESKTHELRRPAQDILHHCLEIDNGLLRCRNPQTQVEPIKMWEIEHVSTYLHHFELIHV